MKVAIIMGSDSDWGKMEAAEQELVKAGVEVDVLVASAHRTPNLVHEFVANARANGIEVIIAAAGAAAHLPGVVSAFTTIPVIGVPINATGLGGMDALLSIAQMPSGIPVATMAIDGAKNAGLYAVQMLSVKYPQLVEYMSKYRANMEQEVLAKGARLKEKRGK